MADRDQISDKMEFLSLKISPFSLSSVYFFFRGSFEMGAGSA